MHSNVTVGIIQLTVTGNTRKSLIFANFKCANKKLTRTNHKFLWDSTYLNYISQGSKITFSVPWYPIQPSVHQFSKIAGIAGLVTTGQKRVLGFFNALFIQEDIYYHDPKYPE